MNLDHDLTSFVCLAEERTIPELFDEPFNFQESSYDGFYFYSYAHDPLAKPQPYRVINGKPVYHIEGVRQSANYPFRKKRIGYSALAYLLSGLGQPNLIPLMLVVINILAFVLLIHVVRLILNHLNRDRRWVYFALLFAGGYICLARDLADLMALALAGLTVYLIQRRSLVTAALVGTAALFTKENIIFMIYIPVLVLLLDDLRKRQLPRAGILAWILPIVLYGSWNYHLWLESAAVAGYRSPGANFTLPFVGLVEGLQTNWIAASLSGVLVLAIYALSVEALIAVWAKRHQLIAKSEYLIWPGIFICYLGISICFSYKIYEDFWSLGRNLLPLQLAAFITVMTLKGRVSRFNVVLTALAFIVIVGLMMVRV